MQNSRSSIAMQKLLLVADEQEVCRRGLVSICTELELRVVAETSSGAEVLRLAAECQPDAAILGVRASGDDFVSLEQLRKASPSMRIVILSESENPTHVAQAILHGADDFLVKSASRRQLLEVITAVAGTAPTATEITRRVTAMLNMQQPLALDDEGQHLTPRESQVLTHLAFGLSNLEIATSLSLNVETVRVHIQHVLDKLAMTDRVQAAVWALRRGIGIV